MESHIQSYLRVAASHQRDTEQIGPFLATFSRSNNNPFLNYAIPDENATPSPVDVTALIVAYEKRLRRPRLEYITQLAPAVEEVLINAGFCVEGHLPLMTYAPGSEQSLPIPPGIELILPVSDDDLFATISVQNEAYGAPPPDVGAIAALKSSLKAGGIAVLARIIATGEPVGAGVCTVPSNQTTEIAGIGVRPAFRRRGVAGALTTRLVQEAFASGVSVPFLMAAHEAEKRIYARAGFSIVGKILHISYSKP
ncbi:GNAT family N-acetyltransferase [Scytonema sp. NUACC26]|uniref:GNAT family N-acetyltransferase n=1 Tax=Scytonema sp. NUACC26 TaxID=3140176 RepID=UPI0034DBC981